jgi:hypothetical protein
MNFFIMKIKKHSWFTFFGLLFLSIIIPVILIAATGEERTSNVIYSFTVYHDGYGTGVSKFPIADIPNMNRAKQALIQVVGGDAAFIMDGSQTLDTGTNGSFLLEEDRLLELISVGQIYGFGFRPETYGSGVTLVGQVES